MRGWLLMALVLAPGSAVAQAMSGSYEQRLEQRADSLVRLDPAVELRAALRRGDRRCIAITWYSTEPAGVPSDSLETIQPILCAAGMHVIEGTSDHTTGGVARLNAVAVAYGAAYNRLLLAVLRQGNTGPVPDHLPNDR